MSLTVGDPISVMTGGFWSDPTGVVTTTQIQYIRPSVLVSSPLPDIPTETRYESIGIIPQSGIKTEHKITLTYGGNTEWFYFESPYQRLRSKQAAMTLFDFHKTMKKTLDIVSGDIAYLPAYPDYVLTHSDESKIGDSRTAPDKIITYFTIKSEPGSLSGKPFGGTQEIKPRIREQLFLDPLFRKDIDDPAENLKYYKTTGQWFDNLVQFDLWTKTNYEAEEFIEWFEDILDRYRGMFKELGMQEMVYYRRVRDDSLMKFENKFSVRSLIYFFRTEKVKVTEIRPIKRINITGRLKHCNYLYPSQFLVENEAKILNKWLKSGG